MPRDFMNMTNPHRPQSHDAVEGVLANQVPRRPFLRALLAGSAFLVPFSRAAPGRPRPPEGVSQPPAASTGATKIMIIRHAEKPVGQINGVDASGNQDPNSLIPQGWQRAGALVALFGSSFGPLPAPTHLFAPNQFGSGSKRPFETITPLAAKLGLTMNATPAGVSPGEYAPTDYPLMVPDALGCPGVVLIAWEHEFIPSIANLIVGNTTAVPQAWPAARFDVVWTFDLDPATNKYSFNQHPQLLLQGDLPTPLPYAAS